MIRFEKVTHADMQGIYMWRNNPLNRKYSYNDKELDFEDHMHWFEKEVDSKESHYIIGYLGKMPLGVVRFAYNDTSLLSTTILIYLVPGLHGLGIGELLLRSAIAWLYAKYRIFPKIIAEIKEENIASITIFERCGFIKENGKWVLRPKDMVS